MNRECVSCIKRKTTFCPTSMECMATDDMPYYQNRMMLLKENEQLKIQISAREEVCNRLESNWNKLKESLEAWKENEKYCYLASSPIDRCRKDIYREILEKMQELEGSDSNVKD